MKLNLDMENPQVKAWALRLKTDPDAAFAAINAMIALTRPRQESGKTPPDGFALCTAHEWYGKSLEKGRCARCQSTDYHGSRCEPHWESSTSGFRDEREDLK